jgi:DNA-nicking Smr family endonuclease
MRGARPLRGARVVPPGGARAAPAPKKPDVVPAAAPFLVERSGDGISGRAPDIGPPVVRALQRGEPPIHARLDLHGRVTTDVGHAVERFLAAARSRGVRAALLIHGWGRGSDAGPLLRPAVWDWLGSAAAARAGVTAFCSAARRDGGAGATVVLLRRSGR